MSTPFKMKGFSGFGNSPLRHDKKDKDGNTISHKHAPQDKPLKEKLLGPIADANEKKKKKKKD